MCEKCELVKEVNERSRQLEEEDENEEDETNILKQSHPPIDCSKATHYYPEAGMDTPKGERGSLSPLTYHACTYPDQNTTIYENVYRYGASCCAYDYATEQCGLWENDYYGYQYTNEAKGRFLYPCSFGPTSSTNIGAIAGGIIGALICAFTVAYIAFKRRKRFSSREETQSKDDFEESKKPIETKKDHLACNNEENKAFNYENITPVPLPSAPQKEEYDIVIASPVISNNGENEIVYDAQIVTDNIGNT